MRDLTRTEPDAVRVASLGPPGGPRALAARRAGLNVSWPASEVGRFRAQYKEARTTHRISRTDGSRLTLAAFYESGYLYARTRAALWLMDVKPARWRVSSHEPYRQVLLAWPDDLVEIAQEDFEHFDRDAGRIWGPDFQLTKSHLLLAAIRHGVDETSEGANWKSSADSRSSRAQP